MICLQNAIAVGIKAVHTERSNQFCWWETRQIYYEKYRQRVWEM